MGGWERSRANKEQACVPPPKTKTQAKTDAEIDARTKARIDARTEARTKARIDARTEARTQPGKD